MQSEQHANDILNEKLQEMQKTNVAEKIYRKLIPIRNILCSAI